MFNKTCNTWLRYIYEAILNLIPSYIISNSKIHGTSSTIECNFRNIIIQSMRHICFKYATHRKYWKFSFRRMWVHKSSGISFITAVRNTFLYSLNPGITRFLWLSSARGISYFGCLLLFFWIFRFLERVNIFLFCSVRRDACFWNRIQEDSSVGSELLFGERCDVNNV